MGAPVRAGHTAFAVGVAIAAVVALAPHRAAADAPLSVGAGFSTLVTEKGGFFGWRADFGVEPRPWLQVVGDISGHYGNDAGQAWSIHYLLGGVRFQLPRTVTPFATALIGPILYSEENESGGQSTTGWVAVVIGGGVDLAFGPRVLLRIQADALWHLGVLVPYGRFTIGLAVRFGGGPPKPSPAR